MATTESLLITCLADGTYHVKETEGAGDSSADGQPEAPPIDQSVKSPDDVLSLVQQFLSDCQGDMGGAGSDAAASPDDAAAAPDDGADPKAAWNAEAAKRDPASGLRM
jgi:hypothetical protein